MSKPALQVEHLCYGYSDIPVLEGVDVVVAPGEVVLVLGANGAGKSTLLRCILGTLDAWPCSTIRVAGTHLVRGRDQPDHRRRLAFVADNPALYDDLTLRQQADITAGVWQVPDWEARFAELVDLLGLNDRADQMPATFSRGLRQKAGLCLAFLHDADLLLIDEPFVGLDQPGRAAFVELMTRAQRRGAAALVATHTRGELLDRADRAIGIEVGRLLKTGVPVDVALALGEDPSGASW